MKRVEGSVLVCVLLFICASLNTAILAQGEDPGLSEKEPPRYFIIPLRGVVGQEIVASAMEEAFKAGLKKETTVLVLEIDSPGGLISECEKIIKLLSKIKERRSIAYIKSALSAAAIISLTCDEIYMHRDATIGAATAIEKSIKGSREVDEKFKSVWRSTCRRAAEIGGHNSLFAEAMVDPRIHLRLIDEDGQKKVVQVIGRDSSIANRGKAITLRGKLLTITAMEATSFGLADGVVDELQEISRVAPRLADWKPVSRKGVQIMESFAKRFNAAIKQIDKEMKTASEEFDLAVEFDPSRQSYAVTRNRRFTPSSRAKWFKYSKACYNHLGRCERALDRVTSLGKKFPILQAHTEFVAEKRDEIAGIRESIKRGAKRAGI